MSNRLESKIEYEQLPAGGGMTRRQGRWLIVLLIVNTMLLAVGVVGPQIGPTVRKGIDDFFARRAAKKAEQQQAAARAAAIQQSASRQNQWMAYTFPPDTVVYEQDPKLAAAYLISGKGFHSIESRYVAWLAGPWQPPVIAPAPPAVALLAASVSVPNGGLLLAHERRTPDGKPKLVAVAVGATEQGLGISNTSDRRVVHEITIAAQAWDPLDPNASNAANSALDRLWTLRTLKLVLPKEVETTVRSRGAVEVRRGANLRIYAGSVDPNDATHFSVPYLLGTRKGSIDGWLREDGIELRGREGEMGPQSSWNLPPP